MREALRWLTDHNLIDRRRGAGTTVKNSEPSPSFIYRLSSLAEMLKYPEDTYRENLVSTMVQVDPQLADYIGSPIGHEWYRIGGLRRSDRSDLPICWSDIYVLPEFAPLIADETTSNEPVFQRIERERGVVIANAQIRIFASSIEGELARLLRVADGSPALTFVRRYLDETGRNFESTVTIHPEKRFEYALELHRDGAGGASDLTARPPGAGRWPGQPSVFSRVPRPVTVTRILSPDTRYLGGENPMPTPTGVPVAMMSPGSRVMVRVSVSISVGMSKIRSSTSAS